MRGSYVDLYQRKGQPDFPARDEEDVAAYDVRRRRLTDAARKISSDQLLVPAAHHAHDAALLLLRVPSRAVPEEGLRLHLCARRLCVRPAPSLEPDTLSG